MSRFFNFIFRLSLLMYAINVSAVDLPWSHGDLKVTRDGRYFCHGDGTPFFWMGDTGWLLPERLDREEAVEYLSGASAAGFNVCLLYTSPSPRDTR